jgi:predicted cupin superfamily sugar epimerase
MDIQLPDDSEQTQLNRSMGDGYVQLPQPVHHLEKPLSSSAKATIQQLHLEPHPEGGWFRRDWQSSDLAKNGRPLASLIYFLLPEGDFSEWHKVDADEVWLWHGDSPVQLGMGGNGEQPRLETVITLGSFSDTQIRSMDGESDVTNNVNYLTSPGHAVVPAGTWQRTLPSPGDCLVSCVVSPGFVFSGFDLQ